MKNFKVTEKLKIQQTPFSPRIELPIVYTVQCYFTKSSKNRLQTSYFAPKYFSMYLPNTYTHTHTRTSSFVTTSPLLPHSKSSI